MSPPTWEDTPHLGAGSRYGPTPPHPTAGQTGHPPATAPRAREQPWPPTAKPGHRSNSQPTSSPIAPIDLAGPSTNAMATLPEVLTAREAAAILRVGRNQLYQA